MSIVRWDPFRELEDVNERLNRIFGRSLVSRDTNRDTNKEALVAFDWAPSCDIAENSEEYIIKAELPGVNKDDVKVNVENGIARIHGERRQEKEEKDKKFHRVERSYGSFLRTFSLPTNVDEGKIVADYKDGVLTVRLPKAPNAKHKAVDIKIT